MFEDVFCAVRDEKCSVLCVTSMTRWWRGWSACRMM